MILRVTYRYLEYEHPFALCILLDVSRLFEENNVSFLYNFIYHQPWCLGRCFDMAETGSYVVKNNVSTAKVIYCELIWEFKFM
jgi:hypothetical protein